MDNKIYNRWITEVPKVILQDVLVTLKGSNKVELAYVDYELDRNNLKMVCGYGNILAYMNIQTVDKNKEGWHGDYIDEEEPEKDGRYIVCYEYNNYNKIKYRLAVGHWKKDRFVENREVVGWREFPKAI